MRMAERWIFPGKVHKKPHLHLKLFENEKEYNALRGCNHVVAGRQAYATGPELQRYAPDDRGEREV